MICGSSTWYSRLDKDVGVRQLQMRHTNGFLLREAKQAILAFGGGPRFAVLSLLAYGPVGLELKMGDIIASFHISRKSSNARVQRQNLRPTSGAFSRAGTIARPCFAASSTRLSPGKHHRAGGSGGSTPRSALVSGRLRRLFLFTTHRAVPAASAARRLRHHRPARRSTAAAAPWQEEFADFLFPFSMSFASYIAC